MKLQKIVFSKNRNSSFIGNQIGIVNNYFNMLPDVVVDTDIDFSLRESGKFNELFEDKRIVNSPLFRHELENKKFEQIIKLSQLYNYEPILRIYGCFTSLSSIRQRTETSDLAQLELLEKANILKFIEARYETRIIISLDEYMIFSNNRYSAEQYNERCNDILNTLKLYKDYKNLKVVIDSGNNLEAMYIFDTLVICYLPTLLFDSQNITYGQAIFDSEINNITNKIKIFDSRFSYLLNSNYQVNKLMNFRSKEEFLKYVMERRKNNFFHN